MRATRPKPRGLAAPSDRRWKPVRLCDVPAEVRIKAARRLADVYPSEAGDILAAAVWPSRTVYYVAG